jgi:hypothetical protein
LTSLFPLPVFIRVASVNTKGSILSDFHVINDYLSPEYYTFTIDQFHCLSDDLHRQLSFHWLISHSYRFDFFRYYLYYVDTIDGHNELVRSILIDNDDLVIDRQHSFDRINYQLNTSSMLNMNTNRVLILRFHLAAMDNNEHQLAMTSQPIYGLLTQRYGKNVN